MEHFHLTERLHTDVLEDFYGPISAKVIRHDKTLRESHLIDEKGISRTYAITFFPKKEQNLEIKKINEEIRKGAAIGKCFRTHKYTIRKNVLDVYIVKLPLWLKKEFSTKHDFAKARISEFMAKKTNSIPVVYGMVIEVYSPEFRPPIINMIDFSQTSASTDSLKKLKINMVEVWNRIGRDNDYHDIQSTFDKGKELTLPLLFELKNKIEKYMNKKH